jgi:hypothetical protein
MKFKIYMLIAAVLALLYGVGFLFAPTTVLGYYGVKLNEPGRFVALYFGSALLGTAVTWWRVREAKTLFEAREGVLLGGIVLSVTGLIVAFIDALTGPSNSVAWINPIIYGFLTIGFGYFYFKNVE